jgi:acyl-CoA thioesterase I
MMSNMTRLTRRKLIGRIAVSAFVLLGCLKGPASAAPPSHQATLLVLGDSISAEYGLARDTGWVQLLRDRLKQQHFDYNVVNASISGDTTSNGLARLPPLLLREHPDIVVIELGGNDGLRGLPIDTARGNLAQIIALCQAAHARVVITGIQLPPNYGPDYTTKFAAMYGELAKDKHVALVPFLFAGFAEDSELFQGDRIHPSAEAQPMLLNNVWGPLKPLLTARAN